MNDNNIKSICEMFGVSEELMQHIIVFPSFGCHTEDNQLLRLLLRKYEGASVVTNETTIAERNEIAKKFETREIPYLILYIE